jgi:hypothetical protein
MSWPRSKDDERVGFIRDFALRPEKRDAFTQKKQDFDDPVFLCGDVCLHVIVGVRWMGKFPNVGGGHIDIGGFIFEEVG